MEQIPNSELILRPALPAVWWVGILAALTALAFAFFFYRQMMRESEGTPKMIEIASAVREGAMAYLRRQYRIVSFAFLALVVVFAVMAVLKLQSPVVPIGFLTGGILSGLAGFIGMKAATNASARTAHATATSLTNGLKISLRAGAVMGLVVVVWNPVSSALTMYVPMRTEVMV